MSRSCEQTSGISQIF